MFYDLLIPLVGAFIISGLVMLRLRAKKAKEKEQNARRRTARSGLVLERSPKEKRAARPSSLAGPLILALAVFIIGSWLALSYFRPGGGANPPEAAADGGSPADLRVMSGRIVMGEDSAPPAANASPQPPQAAPQPAPPAPEAAENAIPAPAPGMAQASRGILPAVSRMEQVGLMPAKAAAQRPRAQKPPAASPSPAPAQPAARTEERPAPKPSAPPPARAEEREEDRRPILGGTREFTVHLASFTERGNAEKYMGRLVSARVKDAFITESMVNGRLWYRVMSGRFPSQAGAEAHGNDLRRRDLTASGGRFVIKSIP